MFGLVNLIIANNCSCARRHNLSREQLTVTVMPAEKGRASPQSNCCLSGWETSENTGAGTISEWCDDSSSLPTIQGSRRNSGVLTMDTLACTVQELAMQALEIVSLSATSIPAVIHMWCFKRKGMNHERTFFFCVNIQIAPNTLGPDRIPSFLLLDTTAEITKKLHYRHKP